MKQKPVAPRELSDECQRVTSTISKKSSKTCNGFCGEYECKENQANCKRLKKASEK